ncbi:MAG: TPR end-of-group domain-containing protein [Chloroflexia bacterium]
MNDAGAQGSTGPIKPGLLEMLGEARTLKRGFIDGLSVDQREAVGDQRRWSARDLITHVTFWERWHAGRLAATLRGEEPVNSWDEDEFNNRLLAEHRLRPWAEIEREAEAVHRDLVSTVHGATEDELADPQLQPWLHGHPLWLRLIESSLEHPVFHYAEFYRENGDLQAGNRVREAMVDLLVRLFPESIVYCHALYNLACFYSLTGQPGPAIDALRESFRRIPDFVEWSKHDSDLDSLRDLPAFQRLYQGEAQ